MPAGGETGSRNVTAIIPLSRMPAAAIDGILDAAFGPDRRTRTAYRVRAGTSAIDALSFAALDDDGELAGTIQCWPVALACDDGRRAAMVMVGPVAVRPELQRSGIGRQLMAHMLAAAPSAGVTGGDALMLIGDPEYYGRFFGFSAERTGRWRLPGPFEPHRLLARGAGIVDCAGIVEARIFAGA